MRYIKLALFSALFLFPAIAAALALITNNN